MSVDLELATVNQIMGELAKRETPFICLIPPNDKVAPPVDVGRNASQIHIYGMGPHDTLRFLAEAGMLLHTFTETGEVPPGVEFFCQEMDEDGNVVRQTRIKPMEIPYEEEENCWDALTFEPEEDDDDDWDN